LTVNGSTSDDLGFTSSGIRSPHLRGTENGAHSSYSLLKRGQLFYVSFVTITTLGFGDVLPVSTIVRIDSTVDAGRGQFFLATLIARRVGIHGAHARTVRDSDSSEQ
jgi:hypothetical protein